MPPNGVYRRPARTSACWKRSGVVRRSLTTPGFTGSASTQGHTSGSETSCGRTSHFAESSLRMPGLRKSTWRASWVSLSTSSAPQRDCGWRHPRTRSSGSSEPCSRRDSGLETGDPKDDFNPFSSSDPRHDVWTKPTPIGTAGPLVYLTSIKTGFE